MKNKRQRLILELISTREIETQEELAELLRQHGIEVTQATVSRDIKELGLVKVPTDNNRYRYGQAGERISGAIEQRQQRLFRESVIKIAASENIIVIKTLIGSAQGVGAVIDGLNWPEIIGTVAGDDTIIAVASSSQEVKGIVARLESLME
ncbi:MAG TPA: arginine repressor [Firmicutes bacterium]|nr:arginine repressor [Bacillota bacterium]